MELTKVDNKDGLRELIEMRNKRTKESSTSSAVPATTPIATGSTSATNNSNSPTDEMEELEASGEGSANQVDEDFKMQGLNGTLQESGDHNGSALMSRLRAKSDESNKSISSSSLLLKQQNNNNTEIKPEKDSSNGDNMDEEPEELQATVNTNQDDNDVDEQQKFDSEDQEMVPEALELENSEDLSQEQGAISHDNNSNDQEIADEKDELEEGDYDASDSIDQTPENTQQIDTPKDGNQANPDVWTLPVDRNDCTLDEIRRGQFINKTAHNECPVLGCGKLINDARSDPNPGTISAGLKTHVLFVHYHSRRVTKKRKLNWSRKRPGQPSPKKPIQSPALRSSPSMQLNDLADFERQSNSSVSNLTSAGMAFARPQVARRTMPGPGATSLINRNKPNQPSNSLNRQQSSSTQPYPMSSLQSLIQATGGPQLSPHAQQQQLQQLNLHNQQSQTHQRNEEFQKTINQTTSSLFSILTSLTQQPASQQQPPVSRIAKTASGTNTINVSQCSSRNNVNNVANRQSSSSLLSLLNERISTGGSLQTPIKKNSGNEQRNKVISISRRQNSSPPTTSAFFGNTSLTNLSSLTNDPNYGGSASILNGLCSGNGITRDSDSRPNIPPDNITSLNSFIRSIAAKTNSNIGPNGLGEVKKIIEKFTTSLLCSSQTIADHHVAPFAGEPPQQKPEISPSDVMLAYKMLQKTQL